jgi:hypothetical protein
MGNLGEKKILPVFSVLFLAAILIFSHSSYVKGAGTCSLYLNWSQNGSPVSSVVPGSSATESWGVLNGQEPDWVGAVCSGDVNSTKNSSNNGVSLSGSYPFTINNSETCTVYGYFNGSNQPSCTATATVTANQSSSNPSLSVAPQNLHGGQTFTISLSGAPVNIPTTANVDAWVNNDPTSASGDPNSFQNIGAWVSTNNSGSASQTSAPSCDADLAPLGISGGKTLNNQSNHVLHVRVKIGWNSGQSPEAGYTVDCRPSGGTTTSTPPVSGSCNLFSRASGYPESTHLSFPAGSDLSFNQAAGYDWGYYSGGIEEYLQSDNVNMTASGLPPGLALNHHQVTYPATNMANDGIVINGVPIQDYIAAHQQTGYPPLNRYALTGAPDQSAVGNTYNVQFTASSAACGTQTQTFVIKVTAYQPPVIIPPTPGILSTPSSTNGKIQFVKTLFYNDPAPNGSQFLGAVSAWGKKGDKFVISGEYGGRIANLTLNTATNQAGGGLITLQEDGSKIVERDAAIDAGSGSNQIYQHGHRHSSYEIHLEWDKGGFVMENSSWGSCLSPVSWSDYCSSPGPGANRAVYYKQGGDGFPVPAGKSPLNEGATGLEVFKTLVYQIGGELYSLPKWTDEGPGDKSLQGIPFGNFVIGGDGEVFSVDSDGNVSDEGKNVLDSGATVYSYTFDWSQGFPPRLAILESQQAPAGSATSIIPGKAIKVLRLTSSGPVVDKTITSVPTYIYPVYNFPALISQFAIWGDYIITKDPTNPTHVDVWKDGQKLDSVQMPTFGSNSEINSGSAMITVGGSGIAVSKGGYMAVTIQNAPRQATAFLYKINLPPPSGGGTPNPPISNPPPGGNPPGGGTPPTIGSGACYAQYPNDVQLRTLCEQIEAIKRQICALKPTLDLCASLKN